MAHRTCLIGGCDRSAKTRGLCHKHYAYFAYRGELDRYPKLGRFRVLPVPCVVEGCERSQRAKGLCHLHYRRLRKHGDVGDAAPTVELVYGDPAARFWRKVNRTDTCWYWEARLDANGYGKFWFEGRMIGAHRFAYELLAGPIPDGLVLDHLCRVRNCVNPTHLEPVTERENILRGIGITAVNAKRTHCKHGHLLAGVNLGVKKDGSRYCQECQRVRDRTDKAREDRQRRARERR